MSLVTVLVTLSGVLISGIWLDQTANIVTMEETHAFEFSGLIGARRTHDLAAPAISLLEQFQREAQRGTMPLPQASLIPADDWDTLGNRFVERLRAEPTFGLLYYADARTGHFVVAWEPKPGEMVLSHSQPDVDGGRFTDWLVRTDGTREPYHREQPLPPGFDARQRPWYQLALAQPQAGPVWTDPYQFYDGTTGISAARAWRRPGDNQPQGVFGVDFSLQDLTGFLNESAQWREARVFLVNRQGRVITSSVPQRGDPTEADLTVALSSLPQSAAELPLDSSSVIAIGSPITMLLGPRFGPERILGVARFFAVPGDVEWGYVSLTPAVRRTGQIYRIAIITAGISLLCILAAAGVGWLVATRVSRPLQRIAGQLDQIGHFRLSPEPAPRSFVHEVNVVSEATDRMKVSLRSFGHYVPIDVVRDVVASGQEARLGSELRPLSIFFSDIAGFTSIAEQADPDALVQQLAEYLDAMCAAIEAQGGTIDKFVGDAIVALFNAPRAVPEHAAQSCRAALAAQQVLEQLRTGWSAQGKPLFRTRIGLNCGPVLVGNFGSSERFAYTAIGDAMNLASRLEGLNKVYGTSILASEELKQAAGPGFEWRRLDRVAVVGRHQGTLVYELLGETGQVAPEIIQARDAFERALDAYFDQRFAEAAVGFRAVGEWRLGDIAASVMGQRAAEFEARPPDPDWDGVYVSSHK